MARSRQFPPSVDPGVPAEPPAPLGWERVSFGDVLELIERPIATEPDREYQLVTAKRGREGIVPRETLRGRQILTKSQFEVRAGDFLISRRQIIHGACGLVPSTLDGALVSNEYAVLRPRRPLTLEYLGYFSHTPYFQRTCFHSSVGVDVEKMVFKIDQWLRYGFPLPPLLEQQRIVGLLSSIDDAIEKTQAVIDQVQVVKKGLMQELLTRGLPGRHHRFKGTELWELPDEWEVAAIGDVLAGIDAGWSPRCETRPTGLGEWGVLKVSSVSAGRYLDFENKALPLDLEPRPSLEVHEGDVLVARASGVLELVGRCAYVHSTRARLMLSDKILRLRSIPTRLDARFLSLLLNFGPLHDQVLQRVGGSHMRNISQAVLSAVWIPLPPLEEQNQIASAIFEVETRVSAEARLLEQLQHTKAALMSVLLTGEVRVKPDDEAA